MDQKNTLQETKPVSLPLNGKTKKATEINGAVNGKHAAPPIKKPLSTKKIITA